MGFLQIFKKDRNKIKERILGNNETALEIMSKGIKGKRQCPFMGGCACIGQFCEHFIQFKSTERESGASTDYWRCVHTQMPNLIMELNMNIRELIEATKEKV